MYSIQMIIFLLQIAEKLYVEADCTREAIDMYNNAGKWEQAHRVGNIMQCEE